MRYSALCILGALLVTSATEAWTQAYPSRPVRLIVSSAAGGTGDTIARAVSKVVGKEIGTNVVVDNRPGASGMLAARLLVESEPDGYTMLHTSSGLVTNASFRKKMPYDVAKDILPLANLAQSEGYVVMVNSSVPANSIKELIALGKNKRLFYGSPGIGNAIHMHTALFALRAGIDMTHVPYKGLAPAITAVLSGETQVLFAPAIATKVYVTAGRLRALAVASAGKERMSVMPDVPTLEELGFKNFRLVGGWQGWFVPAKTPATIMKQLHAAVRKGVNSPETVAFLKTGGYNPDGRGPEAFRTQMLSDLAQFKEMARVTNIKE